MYNAIFLCNGSIHISMRSWNIISSFFCHSTLGFSNRFSNRLFCQWNLQYPQNHLYIQYMFGAEHCRKQSSFMFSDKHRGLCISVLFVVWSLCTTLALLWFVWLNRFRIGAWNPFDCFILGIWCDKWCTDLCEMWSIFEAIKSFEI